jgi:hypothetical protein
MPGKPEKSTAFVPPDKLTVYPEISSLSLRRYAISVQLF